MDRPPRLTHDERQGFTIVELLIVVVVIAILAAITLVSYNGVTKSARESSMDATIRDAIGHIEAYKVKNLDKLPAQLSDSGFVGSSNTKYDYHPAPDDIGYCVSAEANGISYYRTKSMSAPEEGVCFGSDGLPGSNPTIPEQVIMTVDTRFSGCTTDPGFYASGTLGGSQTVDWGDGTSEGFVSGNNTHAYAEPGAYQITIEGTFTRFGYGAPLGTQMACIKSVDAWGPTGTTDAGHVFKAAINAVAMAEPPHTVTQFDGLFQGASSFNGDISDWDVSNVIDMYFTFYGANSFKGDISKWDVSHVTSMEAMFWANSTFNQDISDWDVGSVKNMVRMFQGATSFNQDISGWDVSSVTTMAAMFQGATAFNGDISDWDVSSVTSVNSMFNGATGAANVDLTNWTPRLLPAISHVNFRLNAHASLVEPTWPS